MTVSAWSSRYRRRFQLSSRKRTAVAVLGMIHRHFLAARGSARQLLRLHMARLDGSFGFARHGSLAFRLHAARLIGTFGFTWHGLTALSAARGTARRHFFGGSRLGSTASRLVGIFDGTRLAQLVGSFFGARQSGDVPLGGRVNVVIGR